MTFLADEHVPRVFVTTLCSNGHDVLEAEATVGASTADKRLLDYCAENGYILLTHDKKDFAGGLQETVTHAGIIVYTDGNYLRDDPEAAVRTLERVLAAYPPDELADALVWLDEWRR